MPKRQSIIGIGCIGICICFFLFGLGASAQEKSLHDALFELQAQVEGYRERISQSAQALSSLKDATALMEERKQKLLLEAELARLSLGKTAAGVEEAGRKISEHDQRIARERAILAALIRDMAQMPHVWVHTALAHASISEFLDVGRRIELLHNALRESMRDMREARRKLVVQKKNLEMRREELVLLHELKLQEERALQEETERKKALSAYMGKRAQFYTELLRRSSLRAISLQEEFFKQEGVGRQLSVREAFTRAESLTRKVRIRPALLLALVAQESQFGAAQGAGTWKEDMHPSQWSSFLTIVQRLGLNPDLVPVSKKPPYGWGGALGPAQFLPSTWLGYEQRISELTGHVLPSPWNIDDALAGAALKLAEGGAADGTQTAERKAALMYFAGENWQNPAFGFYADSVLELARDIEQELRGAVK